MNNMIQLCSNFRRELVFIENTRPDEIADSLLPHQNVPTLVPRGVVPTSRFPGGPPSTYGRSNPVLLHQDVLETYDRHMEDAALLVYIYIYIYIDR